MTPAPLEKDVIVVRLDGMQGELRELYALAKQSEQEFVSGTGHKLAAYH